MEMPGKQFWIGIAISLALVLYLLHSVDLNRVVSAFRHADYLYCLPIIAVSLLGILIRAFRWRHIMAPLHRASLRNLFTATMIGFMAIDILPFRLGEVARAYLIGRKEPVSKSAALATIIVERLFDIFVLLLFLVWVLFAMSRDPLHLDPFYIKALQGAGILMSALFAGAVCFLFFLRDKTAATLELIERCLRPLRASWRDKILSVLQSFVKGLDILRIGRDLCWIVAYSFLLWGLYGVGNAFMLKAFRISTPGFVPFYLLVVQAFAVGIPSSPGFVGTYDAAVVTGLAAFHSDKAAGLSFAILSHFLLFAPVILYGMVLFLREHISLGTLKKEAQRNETPSRGG